MGKKKGKRGKPYRLIPLVVALALFACTLGCRSDDALQIPIRGTAWHTGAGGMATNANMIVAGGNGAGGASLELLGLPWKNVAWADGEVFVGRIKPKFREVFEIETPLPAWVGPLFPTAVMGPDGKLHAQLVEGVEILIEPPAIEDAAPPPDPETGPS